MGGQVCDSVPSLQPANPLPIDRTGPPRLHWLQSLVNLLRFSRFRSLQPEMSEFTHFDDQGRSQMVNVGDKPVSDRLARASGIIRMRPDTLIQIRDNGLKKGNVLEVARLAAIMAVKKTSDLIPLCHSLPISGVNVEFDFRSDSELGVSVTVRVSAKTGAEMEALTAVSTAALTVYDMCKAIDREMTIENIRLEEKSGGKSGHFVRGEQQ